MSAASTPDVGARPTVLLRCPSGIAGNMWLAAALGLGADPQPLLHLPQRLGLGPARIEWRCERRGTPRAEVEVVDLEVVDVDESIDGTVEDLRSRIGAAELSADLRELALQVLAWRCRGDAGTSFGEQRWWQGELTDTLVDVVGGVMAWDLLDRPAIATDGPVAVGTPHGAILSALEPVPTTTGGCPAQLATATGAALLHEWWSATMPTTEPRTRCEVRSCFARSFGLPPMTASYHP